MAQVHFTPTAFDDLGRLSKPTAQRILNKIRWLAENLDQLTPEPLTGPWASVFKLRVGDFRVLYTLDDSKNSVTIRFVRHHREVYKTR